MSLNLYLLGLNVSSRFVAFMFSAYLYVHYLHSSSHKNAIICAKITRIASAAPDVILFVTDVLRLLFHRRLQSCIFHNSFFCTHCYLHDLLDIFVNFSCISDSIISFRFFYTSVLNEWGCTLLRLSTESIISAARRYASAVCAIIWPGVSLSVLTGQCWIEIAARVTMQSTLRGRLGRDCIFLKRKVLLHRERQIHVGYEKFALFDMRVTTRHILEIAQYRDVVTMHG